MGKHLVLVGAGHAHLTTITAIPSLVKRGHRVTVVGPDTYHYYSGMAPGMLAGIYRPQEVRFNVRRTVTGRGGRFVQDRAVGIDPQSREIKLETGQVLSFDIASFNVGSVIPTGGIRTGGEGVFTVKPIERTLDCRMAILEVLAGPPSPEPLPLVVVGGGPAGVEMAGALWRLLAEAGGEGSITLLAGRGLLEGHHPRVVALARQSLRQRGIEVREGARAVSVGGGEAVLDDGSSVRARFALVAVGVKPSPLFMDSLVPTAEDGGLLVNRYLQSVQYPTIFGGGDCITIRGVPLARVGVYAVRQNPVLLNNLAAALEDKPLQPFDPGSPSFLFILNMGDGRGILKKGSLVFGGRAAFRFKDFIDRRFMRKFQLSGELAEPLGGGPGEDV
ncbi:MAG: FAD-dependent oxidoreductase [bacterium]|nr:MAG: FAD-dependent oxidoreductase [bacterium]